ncbi:MAG: methyltransferase domain-containing protein [Desulfobacteraceae bacterium]|jgi:ubiquinone/menaquinone biosynthesis C-methylase UbiE
MARHVCPFWLGYLLLNPLRKLLEHPDRLLGPFVRPGMTVLEPGCAMGFFTLPLARMVGPAGRVIAMDIQPGMLGVLERRARKAGLSERIEIRPAMPTGLGVEDLDRCVDFAAALHVVHEMPNPGAFFDEVRRTLKPGGRLLVVEPKGHVSAEAFSQTVTLSEHAGFRIDTDYLDMGKRKLLLSI